MKKVVDLLKPSQAPKRPKLAVKVTKVMLPVGDVQEMLCRLFTMLIRVSNEPPTSFSKLTAQLALCTASASYVLQQDVLEVQVTKNSRPVNNPRI